MEPVLVITHVIAVACGFAWGLYQERSKKSISTPVIQPTLELPSDVSSTDLVQCIFMNGDKVVSTRLIPSNKRKDHITKPHGRLKAEHYHLKSIVDDTYYYQQQDN